MSSHRLALCSIPVLAVACMTPPMLRPGSPDAEEAATKGVKSIPYTWRNVEILGGGFVTGIIFSPAEQGLVYARTDIGGSYRLDKEKEIWIPITDHIGRDDSNSMGIESLALDPTNPNLVYMATGTYTKSWAGMGAMLRSSDRGETWESVEMPIKMGGNEYGRSCGERLAVDPNLPERLLFGSRTHGLFESKDSGATWNPTSDLPKGTGDDPIGITVVTFDAKSGKAGKATPVVYAAADYEAGSVHRSKDGGKTWQVVPGQPTGWLGCHMELDTAGTLYVSYGNSPGPNDITDGAIYAFDPKTDAWTDVTPIKPSKEDSFGYHGLSVDGKQAGTVLVTTMDRWTMKDEILRTTDGGKTWAKVGSTGTFDVNGAQYIYWGRDELHVPHWMGDIDIDPFDPDRAMFVTGAGIWTTKNLTAHEKKEPVAWTFTNHGLEETAVGPLVSPPEGAPLLSGMGDICGFRHDDLFKSPPEGAYADPPCNGTTGLDFAADHPDIVVRSGRTWNGEQHGAISQDGGKTWKPFATEPKGADTGGMVTITSDGKTILWTVKGAPPSISRDGGKTWKPVDGMRDSIKLPDWSPIDLQPQADQVNPNKIAIFDLTEGLIYVSTDAGATFEPGAKTLPGLPDYNLMVGSIKAVPGFEGHLWLSTGKELYRSTDGGKSAKPLLSVEESYGVGIGKPAPDSEYPTLYLAGMVKGVKGFYRSTNEGKRWERINDDQHQFGMAHSVEGDPRVFGRVYLGTSSRGILVGEPK